MQIPSQSPTSWLLDHIQLVGWPTVCLLAWKVRGYFEKFGDRAENAEKLLTEMATNHVKHMEASLESIDASMKRQEARWDAYLTAKAAQHRDE